MSTRRQKPSITPTSDLDLEISFLEGVVASEPNYIEALQILGDAYTRRGDYQKGLQTDLKLLKLNPDNPVVLYNLACNLSRLGRNAEALDALEKAVKLGYRDESHLRRDKDLDNLRDEPRFKRICESISSAPR